MWNFVPGVKSIRYVSRFFVLIMLSISGISGYAISCFDFKGKKIQKRILSVPILLLILFEYNSMPIDMRKIAVKEQIPEAYKWLAGEKGNFRVLDLNPLFLKRFESTVSYRYFLFSYESEYIYYSLYHVFFL